MTETYNENVVDAEIEAIKSTLITVPGMAGSPGTIPPPLAAVFAVHQHELGVRVHPELATKKYQHPIRGPRSAYNPAGRYVPIGDPDPEPVRIPRVADYTAEERQVIVAQLQALGDIPESASAGDVAFVVTD
ncbi:phage gene 29 protein family protein [Nocardia puris]|uniref:Uncharacterized protein DUF2744 n=1 Tax=Nocardia puris TaxID=208602 RepID=A0A366DD22_9NOCA|nr:DUF2744 domain-containing protein [Nocardia puris]RBO87957.1 uncharacterized protein DUF2744 [Nocardia puris]